MTKVSPCAAFLFGQYLSRRFLSWAISEKGVLWSDFSCQDGLAFVTPIFLVHFFLLIDMDMNCTFGLLGSFLVCIYEILLVYFCLNLVVNFILNK